MNIMKHSKRNRKSRESFLDKKLNRISLIIGIFVAFLAILEGTLRITDLIFKKPISRIEISGSVRDSEYRPIKDATINVVSTHFQVKSLADGTFKGTLTGKTIGDVIELIIAHPNYKTKYVDRSVSSEKEVFEISLKE